MKNPRERLRNWRDEIQSRLGLTAQSLRQAQDSIESARSVFGLVTHNFDESQIQAIEKIEELLSTEAQTINSLLMEIEDLRAALDRIV